MAKLVFDSGFMKKEYPLLKSVMTIGRDKACDISIPDYPLFATLGRSVQLMHFEQLKKISRNHARLIIRNGTYCLEDTGTTGMGSSYGTYVNMARLDVKKPYLLQDSDKIRFGPVECLFKLDPSEMPEPPKEKAEETKAAPQEPSG